MELISREMAIDHIRVLGGEDRERLIGILSNKEILPTIESRPKGNWIIDEENDWKEEIYSWVCTCSQCGEWEVFRRNAEFCPHCGADMRGKE